MLSCQYVIKGEGKMPLQLYELQNRLDVCFTVFARQGYAKTTTAMLALFG